MLKKLGVYMKCHKCNYKNIIKASYCHNCGEKFSIEEQKDAYNKTIYGKIDSLKKVKSIITLDIITSNIFFRIISLIIVLGIGIYFLVNYGMSTKLLQSNDYEIFYNTELKEYYLIVDDSYNNINISIYRPNRVEELILYHYNLDNTLIENKTINNDDSINLNTCKDDYYIIESNYGNDNKEKLKVFVYHNSDV